MSEPLVIITTTSGEPRRKWRATETKQVDDGAGGFVDQTFPHVGAGKESDPITIQIWNNKKTKEVVDLELVMDNGTPHFEPVDLASVGTIQVTLDGNVYNVAISTTEMNDVVAEIATVFNSLYGPTGTDSGWIAKAVPGEEFKGKVIRRAVVQFTHDAAYGPTGDIAYAKNDTDLNCNIRKAILGNEATDPKANITDVELFVKDRDGGYNSQVITDRWVYARRDSGAAWTNLGATIDPVTGDLLSETKLVLKAVDDSIGEGEIAGGVNDGIATNSEENYCEVELYVQPPAVVTHGLREYTAVVFYNFV